jgi:putative ABC transport system permease protein
MMVPPREAIRDVGADISYVLRRLTRRRLLTLNVVGIMALAMGTSMTVLGWVDSALVRPLGVPAADELITLQRTYLVRGSLRQDTALNWSQVRRLQSIDALSTSAVSTTSADLLSRRVTVESQGDVHNVSVRLVSANYFEVLQVAPAIGRSLAPWDDTVTSSPVALIGHGFWRQALRSDPAVIGRSVRINGVAVTIVGLLGPNVLGTEQGVPPPAFFMPLRLASVVGRASVASGDLDARPAPEDSELSAVAPASRFQLIARVSGSERRAQIQAQAATLLRSDQWSVVPLQDTVIPPESKAHTGRFLQLLAIPVGAVLLLACVHVGVLLRGEAEARKPELTARSMVGATVWRLARLLIVEAVALAAAAGLASIAVAWATGAAIRNLALPGGIEIGTLASSPLRTAGFAALLSFVVGVLTAGPAALQLLRPRTLTWTRGPQTLTTSERWLGRVTAVAQGAACVLAASWAIVFVRTVSHHMVNDLGFNPSGLVEVTLGLSADQRPDALRHAEAALADLRAVPLLRSAAIGAAPLASGSDWSVRKVHVDGEAVELPEAIELVYVSDAYFGTLGQRGIRGTEFSGGEVSQYGLGLVAVVNEAAAGLLWPGRTALGRRLMLDPFVFPAGPGDRRGTCRYVDPEGTPECDHPVRVAECAVIGIVPDVVLSQLGERAKPVVYVPVSQWRGYSGRLAVRGVVPFVVRLGDVNGEWAREVAQVAAGRGMSVEALRSIPEVRDQMLRPQRLARELLVTLSGLVAVITLLGSYATSYAGVIRERHENAIRVALGAQPRQIIGNTLYRATSTLGAGCVIGLAMAWLSTPVMERFTLGLAGFDLLTVLAVACIVVVATAVATYVPLRRILNTDPAELLRG